MMVWNIQICYFFLLRTYFLIHLFCLDLLPFVLFARGWWSRSVPGSPPGPRCSQEAKTTSQRTLQVQGCGHQNQGDGDSHEQGSRSQCAQWVNPSSGTSDKFQCRLVEQVWEELWGEDTHRLLFVLFFSDVNMYLPSKLFRSPQPSLNLNLPDPSVPQESQVKLPCTYSALPSASTPCSSPPLMGTLNQCLPSSLSSPDSRGGSLGRQRHPQGRCGSHRLQRFGPAAERHAESSGPGWHPLYPLQRQVRLTFIQDSKHFSNPRCFQTWTGTLSFSRRYSNNLCARTQKKNGRSTKDDVELSYTSIKSCLCILSKIDQKEQWELIRHQTLSLSLSQGYGLGHLSAWDGLYGEISADGPLWEGGWTQTVGAYQDDLRHAEEEGGGARLGMIYTWG